MNPLRLELLNVGRHAETALDFPQGVLALVGSNGAGKSTLIDSIEVALFGDGARDLAPMLGPFADRLTILLVFEHGSETFRVRRTYRVGAGGRGVATLDFERFEGETC